MKSDIEIARKAKMLSIGKVLSKIKVPDKSSAFSPMGRHIAKINFEHIEKFHEPHTVLPLAMARTQGITSDQTSFS